MILEQTPIQLIPLQTSRAGEDYVVTDSGILAKSNTTVKLSSTQYHYYELLKAGKTIYQIVQSYLAQGKLVSFIEIYGLLEKLNENNWIFGPAAGIFSSLKQIQNLKFEDLNAKGKSLSDSFKKIEKSLAFMRFLGPDLRKVFSQQARIVPAASKTLVCRAGDTNRDLYVIIEGCAGVYKTLENGQRQLLGTLGPGAVFGERAFFLNMPRTADVVTLDKSQIAVFPYSEEIGRQINPSTTAELLLRLRAVQGILSSPIFSKLPSESIESLVFSGKLFSVESGQYMIREGEVGKSFFVIIEGAFSVTQKGQLVRNIGDGGTVGEVALMVSGGVRTASVQAQRKSTVLEIGLNEFYNLLGQNLLLAKEIETLAWQRWQRDQEKSSR